MRTILAWAALRQHWTRTVLAILGVAVSAAMLLDMVMLSGGMRESFRELLLSRGYQLRLAPKGTLPFDTDASIRGVRQIVQILQGNSDIVEVSPVLGATVYIPSGKQTVTSFALGLDPSAQGDYQLLSGRDVQRDDQLVVSDELLRHSSIRVGDSIDVASGYDPQLRSYAGHQRFVIIGRAKFLYTSASQIAVAMRLSTLQHMTGGDDRVSVFMVKTRGGSNSDQVAHWIERQVPRVTVISTQEALAKVDERLSYFRQLAFILGAVSLFVGFLLVTTLMTVSVNERVGEITVMRAIGVSTAHVVQQIVLEGMVISVTGAVSGLGLGLLTAHYLNAILSDFPGLPRAIEFFLFQPKAAWEALGLLMVAGVLAGIYPAWRASSLPIARTLRQEAIA